MLLLDSVFGYKQFEISLASLPAQRISTNKWFLKLGHQNYLDWSKNNHVLSHIHLKNSSSVMSGILMEGGGEGG